MKRLGRWLFNLAAGVSLILLVVTGLLWVRSYGQTDFFYQSGPKEVSVTIISDGGKICCILDRGGNPEEQARPYPIRPRSSGRNVGRERFWPMWERGAVAGFNVGVMNGWWQEHAGGRSYRSLFRGQTPAPLQIPAGAHVHQSFYVVAPNWLLVVFTTLLPAYWLFKRLRRRRLVQAGLCLTCGYDLRATPDRCPECGTIPQHKAAVGSQ